MVVVTICGMPGSGKSSVARELSKILKCKIYSAGDARRAYAQQEGLSLEELNKKAENDPGSDLLVDEHLKKLAASNDNLIIDARLGFFFLPKSIKLFITADENVRAERIFNENRKEEKFSSVRQVKNSMHKRVKSDIKRYSALYNINPYEEKHYDLVLNSTSSSINKIVGDAYRFIMFNSHKPRK